MREPDYDAAIAAVRSRRSVNILIAPEQADSYLRVTSPLSPGAGIQDTSSQPERSIWQLCRRHSAVSSDSD